MSMESIVLAAVMDIVTEKRIMGVFPESATRLEIGRVIAEEVEEALDMLVEDGRLSVHHNVNKIEIYSLTRNNQIEK